MSRKVKQIATIDAETDPFKYGRIPQPFLWVIFDGTRFYHYEHISDAIHFLMTKNWIVYAHNGGKFDYHMPGFLKEMERGQEIMVINGRLARFKIGECEFRDSYNIIPAPLKSYRKDEIDYEYMERGKREYHMEKIISYCEADCKYLYEMVYAFRDQYGDSLTLAGAAMKVWKTRFDNEIPQSDKKFYDAVAPYYYGGRVECFEMGVIKTRFSLFDICSAYPYAMVHDHPISYVPGCKYTLRRASVTDPIVPQSMYVVDGVSRGAFPWREKIGAGLSFPNDEIVRRYHVTGWELQTAIDTGTIGKYTIASRMDFDERVNFTKYVEHFFRMKSEAKERGDKIQTLFSKLFLNSLYGKFASNPQNYSKHIIEEIRFVEVSKQLGMRDAGQLGPWAVLESDLPEEEQRYYCAATAASITGFVRAYLWRNICELKKNGGRVLYCDTDSIAVGGAELVEGKRLGEWECEGKFKTAAIAGKKLYAFQNVNGEWKARCKGVRITAQEIVKVAKGGQVRYKRDAPSFGIRRGKICGAIFVDRLVQMTGKGKR